MARPACVRLFMLRRTSVAGSRGRKLQSVCLGGERLEIRSMLTAAPYGMGTEMPGEVHDDLAALALSASVLSVAPAAVTWGAGLTDPNASSAWDITGMPLGEFHTRLNFVKRATVDPLLAPGNASFWHAHDFFVNPAVDENATLGSLMGRRGISPRMIRAPPGESLPD